MVTAMFTFEFPHTITKPAASSIASPRNAVKVSLPGLMLCEPGVSLLAVPVLGAFKVNFSRHVIGGCSDTKKGSVTTP